MASDTTSETLTVKKRELQLWIREALREELQRWQNTANQKLQTADLEEVTRPSCTLGEILDTEFFGMWRDREDLPDSPTLARALRAQAWEHDV
jgi:hypothetical protein